MRRTQIYLTEEQASRVGQLAAQRATTKAEVIRQILDSAFDTGDAGTESRSAIRATAGLCAGYPDWPEWLDEVRGEGADARLRDLGL